jgi:undecaprenyl-diphosphatase
MYAAATALSIFIPEVSGLIFLYAFFVAYSRVYVGVHFPFDVLGGAFLGWMSGILGTNVFFRLEIWSYKFRRRKPQIPTDIPKKRSK